MKYIVESLGPVKDLPAKGSYGPSKVYTVKFKEDPNWADVFRDATKPAPTIEGSVPCKACGAPLVFAKSEDTGATIPLDVRNLPTYMLVIHEGVAVAKRSPAYVSHFVTCPAASQFSSKPPLPGEKRNDGDRGVATGSD